MSEPTDDDLPPLGEPPSPRRTRPASRVVRRRTAVAALIGLLFGFGAGFGLAGGMDDDSVTNTGRPPGSARVGTPPTTEEALPQECVDTMRSAQQALALVDQAVRDLRNLNLGEAERAAREVERLRVGLDEEVRRCFEQMGD